MRKGNAASAFDTIPPHPATSFSDMDLETQSCPSLRHYTSLYYNSVCSKLHVDKRAVSFLREAQWIV
jgi:hypothetical protein